METFGPLDDKFKPYFMDKRESAIEIAIEIE